MQLMIRIAHDFWRSNGFLWRATRIIITVCVVALTLIMAFEDKLIYFPTKYPDGLWALPDALPARGETFPQIEDCHFVASDGVKLHGWYCSPLLSEAGGSVPVPVEMVSDDLWLGAKNLPNLEIAGSPRNSCRTSARVKIMGVEH